MITGHTSTYRLRPATDDRGGMIVCLDDGTPDPSWARFTLRPGDYIDCGAWVGGEASDG
jgi:hypothetical protein